MYHCHVHYYFIGSQNEIFEIIKGMSPLENFSHEFSESSEPEKALIRKADVIFVCLRDTGLEEQIQMLVSEMKTGAELILIVKRDQLSALPDEMPDVKDIWSLPMTEKEIRFRYLRWQKTFKMSKDLWQTEHYLNSTIDGSPNLIWYKDKNGIHEKVNNSFCKTVGKTKEQVQGQGHAYIWDVEQDDPACMESEIEVMKRRETCVSEETVQTNDGARLLTTYKSPLYDLDGSVMGTVGVAIDVTQEHAYEEEIEKKNHTLETIFTAMDCGMVCHTVDGSQILRINRAALEILGYSSQEEMERAGFDLVAMSVMDEDKPKLRRCIRSLKKEGDSVNIEYRVQHKNGEVLYVMGNIKLIEENGTMFYERFLLDCTAQKLREEEEWAKKNQEIKYQEQLFDIFSTYLSNNTNDVYMMLSADIDKIEYASPNIERVLGVSKEDVEKDIRSFVNVQHTCDEACISEELKLLKPGMALEAMETERVNPKTSEHKWFVENIYCVSIQEEKKVIIYISDRTDDKKIQNALKEALEMAQVANKAKSTFLSSVSHDIRTPMNAIMGLVTLLKEEADNPGRVVEYTQKISAASQHLLGLINDVLDMNKIESGSTTLDVSELDLAEVIEDMNTIIRPQVRAKNQTFEIFTSSLVNEYLLGDKLRINQILINILSNAVKYTQKGGRIKMRVRELPQVDEKYSRIQFVISDNGQGMSEEYQKVIFHPFTREKDAMVNQIQGTGLGMAITKNLVDLMNGTISVESKLGEGSTFTVELELRIQAKEIDKEFWNNYGVFRMLVADDDEEACEHVKKSMWGTGVITHSATDGQKAVEMLRDARESGKPYNLILLDWKMPGLDGLETARLIKKNYPDKIPILLLTAYDWEEIEQEAIEIGVNHFLPKPFFMTNFMNAIRRVMEFGQKPVSEEVEYNAIRGMKILVVDDIEVNRLILVKILNKLEANCCVAENGQMAVEMFENSAPGEYDMIIMDIQMPVMDGYTATKTIRASSHPSAKSVSIIAMTANAFVDDIRKAMDSGMDAHVAKPIMVDQLKETLEEVLSRKKHG